MSQLKKQLSNNLFLSAITNIYRRYFSVRRKKFGFIDKTARVRYPIVIKGINNVYLYENTHIMGDSMVIATRAKFIMMRNSGSAEGLTVVTGNHYPVLGEWKRIRSVGADEQIAKDVVVEEDVWLAANVTLLSGVRIGRGSTIGAGSVCTKSVPPYAIVMGNPAKVIGFNFTPEEIIEHEKALYPEDKRLPIELLITNYNRYFKSKTKEIMSFIKL